MTDPKDPNDVVKKSATIVLKGIAKRVLAVWGVPGEVVDIATEIVTTYLANPNDAAAQKAFKQLQEEIVSELAVESDKYKGGRPPSPDDVEQGLIRFATAYRKAGSHDKRRMLFTAFHNCFRSQFYDEGMAQILWPKVEALEYPDIQFLDRILFSLNEPGMNTGVEPMKVHDRGSVRISNKDLEFEFTRRLEAQGLLVTEGALSKVGSGGLRAAGAHGVVTGDSGVSLRPTGIARTFRDFVLEGFWADTKGTGDNPG